MRAARSRPCADWTPSPPEPGGGRQVRRSRPSAAASLTLGGRFVNVWPTLIGAVIALAGVAVSPAITAGHERRRWLLERRYDIVRGVTTSARTVLWRGDEIDASRTDISLTEQIQLVRKAMFDLREWLALVDLLFDGRTVDAAKELEGHYNAHVIPYFSSISSRADSHKMEVVQARKLMVSFQNAGRGVLRTSSTRRRLSPGPSSGLV